MSHKHITLFQQNEIAVLLRAKTKQKDIANIGTVSKLRF